MDEWYLKTAPIRAFQMTSNRTRDDSEWPKWLKEAQQRAEE